MFVIVKWIDIGHVSVLLHFELELDVLDLRPWLFGYYEPFGTRDG